MKTFFSKWIALIFCATVLVPGSLWAKTKTERVREFDKIASVKADAKEVTIYDHLAKEELTYKINPLTKILLDGKPATLADLKKGMKVALTGNPSTRIASKIEAEEVADEEPAKDKKKKK